MGFHLSRGTTRRREASRVAVHGENGYFATRGAAPEWKADQVHYPGTYAAGVYNRLVDDVSGTAVDNESLVNLPNWLPLTFRVDGGGWFDLDTAKCCPTGRPSTSAARC